MFENSPRPEMKDEMNDETMNESVASRQRNATVDAFETVPEQVTCIRNSRVSLSLSLSLSDSKLGPQLVAAFAQQLQDMSNLSDSKLGNKIQKCIVSSQHLHIC